MGATYRWKCNKCWHLFKADLGHRMRGEFPEELTEEARKGVYGEALKALLAFYPDAEVSGEQVIVQCEHCYRYEGRPLLAAYECFAGLPCPRCSGTMKPQTIVFWD